jgi:hypothetical protein
MRFREWVAKAATLLVTLRPRQAGVLAALVFVGWACHFAFSEETPRGSLRGRVVLAETLKPIAGVTLYITDEEATKRYAIRRAISDKEGRFFFPAITTGAHSLSAHAKAHSANNCLVYIDEGEEAQITLVLWRSQPYLAIARHSHIFATTEKAGVSVRGYVDTRKPPRTDALMVRLFRTRLSEIMQNEQRAEALNAMNTLDGRGYLPPILLYPSDAPAPSLVLEKRMPITEDDIEGFFHQRVDFGKLEPGLYLLEAQHVQDTVSSWFLVTDAALVVKRAGRQVLAYVVNIKKGTPISGSQIRVYQTSALVAQGRTGSDGLASLSVPAGERGSLTVVAVHGEDEAVVNGYLYEQEDGGDFAVYAYTDRPLYRPGQRIYYKGIARRKLEAGGRYAVPSGEPVAVEIRDPSGERILQAQHTTNPFGSFYGHVDLSPEASTGVYALILTLRGEKHTQDIVVGSFKKPEFAVTLTPTKPRYVRGEQVEVVVEGQYYFGAPVAGAKVIYFVYRHPDWTAEYPEDTYDPEFEEAPPHGRYSEGAYGEFIAEGEAVLDENGKANIRFPAKAPETPNAPQMQILAVSVSVIDDAGRLTDAYVDVPVAAGDFRLAVSPAGYVAEPGQPMDIVVKAADFTGKPIAGVPITLEYGMEWLVRGEYKFSLEGTRKLITGPDGLARTEITLHRAGEWRLAVQANDAAGRTVRARGYLWVAGEGDGDLHTEYADLSLLTDKHRYRPGETVRVLINAARFGQTALLTVEGDRIYHSFLVPLTKRSTLVRIPVLKAYGPNVYLAACYVRDKMFAQSQIPLRVHVPQQEILVKIESNKPKYEPGEEITYRIQTTNSQGQPAPCEFSFGVVDESIYALREDDPNALRHAFYPRRYNAVITEYSFATEYLGDANKAEPKIEARKKFLDTAFWQPTLHTDAQGRARVAFHLPDNLTTWRATAIAHTTETELGWAIQKVIVTKDFFVRIEAPRLLTSQDRSQIAALVHNQTNTSQTVLIRLRTENLSPEGALTQTLSVPSGQVGRVVWPVRPSGIGTAKIDVAAWTSPGTGQRQYTDRVQFSLPIKPYGRLRIDTIAGEILAGKPTPEILRLDPAAIPGTGRLTVRLTPSVAGALAGALEYLVGYPYGCTEQTISRFLPDVLARRALRLWGMRLPKETAIHLPQMVRDGLLRLYRLQHAETGGWGWWENDKDDPWMTAYVLYGLAIAKREGFAVSEAVLARGRNAAWKMVPSADSHTKAFLLYALALAGEKEAVRVERRAINEKFAEPEALGYLVLLDRLLGVYPHAAVTELNRRAISDTRGTFWRATSSGKSSDIAATATALRAILALNRRDERINAILRWLMLSRTENYWASTRDTSWVVAALCDYLKSASPGALRGELRVTLNGEVIHSLTLTPELAREPEVVLHVPTEKLRAGRNDLTLERPRGEGVIFYTLVLRQMVAMEEIPAFSPSKIGIYREYLRVLPQKVGSDSWALQTEPTNGKLRQGDRIRVRITLHVPQNLEYVVIEDPYVAGCEVTERGTAEETVEWGYWWSSIDVREDKVAFFARNLPKGKHVIEYNLRAQTPGEYRALPTFLQPMYAPGTWAESAEVRVEVK